MNSNKIANFEMGLQHCTAFKLEIRVSSLGRQMSCNENNRRFADSRQFGPSEKKLVSILIFEAKSNKKAYVKTAEQNKVSYI